MTNIKAVFFDWDDTLVDTLGPKWAQHQEAYRQMFGEELSNDVLLEHWGEPLKTLIANIYKCKSPEELSIAESFYLPLASQYPKLIKPHTKLVLETLRENNIMMGIVTATRREFLNLHYIYLEAQILVTLRYFTLEIQRKMRRQHIVQAFNFAEFQME